jgi:oxygen-independent coproporphyrinogen-3 oxidase
MARALYIHVPFCVRKCRYCDFYSIPLADPARARPDVQAFLDALGAELARHAGQLQPPLGSIFVGGGTPTALAVDDLATLLAPLRGLAGPDTEWTVEANPGTLDPAKAAALAAAGVNRVSVGAQSLHPRELQLLGRIHAPGDVADAVATLRSAGVGNIALDLIYGLPGQTPATWRATLEAALALRPEHLSCYCLSYEAGTPLAAARDASLLAEMDELTQEACYRAAIAATAGAGLEHYETSNFARPGRRCRHNLVYWHNEEYLGLGPAATSYLAGRRRTNRPDVRAYVESLQAGGDPPCEGEHLTGRTLMAETAMLALRLVEGLDRAAFRQRFGLDVLEVFPRSTALHVRLGGLIATPTHVRIAEPFFFLADAILADVVAEA